MLYWELIYLSLSHTGPRHWSSCSLSTSVTYLCPFLPTARIKNYTPPVSTSFRFSLYVLNRFSISFASDCLWVWDIRSKLWIWSLDLLTRQQSSVFVSSGSAWNHFVLAHLLHFDNLQCTSWCTRRVWFPGPHWSKGRCYKPSSLVQVSIPR